MKYTMFTMAGTDHPGRRIAVRRDLIRAVEDLGGRTAIYINETEMEPYGAVTQIIVLEDFDTVFSRINVVINVRGE